MKKNIGVVYTIEIAILLFIIMYQTVILKSFRSYSTIIEAVFFMALAILGILITKYPKDKSYYKSNTIRIVIITLLAQVLFIYLLGLIVGFGKVPFSHEPLAMIYTIVPILFEIIGQEIVRYLVCKHSSGKIKPIVILTILFIALNIIIEIGYSSIKDMNDLFVIVCTNILPMISKELLFSYLTYKVGITPTLLYRIPVDLFIYFVPFYPSLGNYFTALIGIITPFVVYKFTSNAIIHAEKKDKYVLTSSIKLLTLPLAVFLVIVIILISGVLRYKLVAIGSNSMLPVYARGDAVLVDQSKKDAIEDIRVGDILVFEINGTIVTHRVTSIAFSNGHYVFTTKGDNNEQDDKFITQDTQVRGVVIRYVKYIGYPTILLQEALTKE